jgi:hypothetical protein
MMAILSRAGAQSSDASKQSWCTINPAQPMQGHSVQIAQNKLYIVLASEQANAAQRLSNDAFVKIDRREASQLVRNPAELPDAGNYYLVRASAFYVDQNYSVKSRLEAYLFPEEKALQVINTSLSQSGTKPVNLALVVETEFEIQKAEIICLTAS